MLMMQLYGVADVECLFLHAYATAGTIKAAAAPPTSSPPNTLEIGVEDVTSPPDPPQSPGVHFSKSQVVKVVKIANSMILLLSPHLSPMRSINKAAASKWNLAFFKAPL